MGSSEILAARRAGRHFVLDFSYQSEVNDFSERHLLIRIYYPGSRRTARQGAPSAPRIRIGKQINS